MTDRPACAGTRPLLPELAAGIASAEERARSLRHLAGCGRCHRELEAHTALVDELLLLAPERQPPAGFEAAVLAPMTQRRGPRRRRLRDAALLAAAAVLIAATSAGSVWRQTEDDRALADGYRETLAVAKGRYLKTVAIDGAGSTPAGYVFAYQGTPAWLFVTMPGDLRQGDYRITLTSRDGRTVPLGTMTVRPGGGSWGRTIPLDVHDILVLRIHDPGGGELLARFMV
ncbi:anti-sigma factor family protein [Actinomadura sp. SCN-SB]|uniref:anti-sigma factor family protein n=1 Tax=Actinomadura sp. SCN-SB TaxID=3373092 RepID=UPI00375148C5